MSRKITTKEWKNRRDFNAWKIELDDYNMSDPRVKYDEAIRELAGREEKRIGVLKDTLWEAAVPFFGVNITPEKLREKFEEIMNAKCNENAVFVLMTEEEERVKAIEVEEAARLEELRGKHTKLVNNLDRVRRSAANKSEGSSASETVTESDEISDEDEFSENEPDIDDISEDENEPEEYLNSPEFNDRMPEETFSEESKT